MVTTLGDPELVLFYAATLSMPPLAKLLKRKRCQASRSQGGSRAASNVSKWNSANVDVAPLHADSSSEESEGASQGFNQGPGAYRELLHALKHQRRSVNVQDAWMVRQWSG